MNVGIPIRYDMMLRPEWIDYALEQYFQQPDVSAHRKVVHTFLEGQIKGQRAAVKTAAQLLQNVGANSSISRDRLEAYYQQMSRLSPDERSLIRLCIMEESSPFFADCVIALRKLDTLGVKCVGVRQLYERITAKYGDRDTVYRRVRYVLTTLLHLGAVENRDKGWYLTDVGRGRGH